MDAEAVVRGTTARPGTLHSYPPRGGFRGWSSDYGPSNGVSQVADGTSTRKEAEYMSTWTFITNHARVMMVISQDPTVRLRDIASTLDITERAAQRIVTELVDEGYLSRKREGRRNTYTVHPEQGAAHPAGDKHHDRRVRRSAGHRRRASEAGELTPAGGRQGTTARGCHNPAPSCPSRSAAKSNGSPWIATGP